MKPAFSTLWANYPKGDSSSVFNSIGWSQFLGKSGWENTCAIRMSICLDTSGVKITSSAGMNALSGPAKGKPIEIRQDVLSKYLEGLWGAPLKCLASEGYGKIGKRHGVISYWKISGYSVGGALGGHIDLFEGSTKTAAHGDYMTSSQSIWFWETP